MPLPSSSIVTKCIRVLDILTEASRPLGFSEVVARSGFTKSSAHRILGILHGEGLAEYCSRGKTYRTGEKMMHWMLQIWRGSDIQQAAHQQLETLCEHTAHNAALAVRDGDTVFYIRTVDSYPVRYAPKVGEHAPLHCTAVGKVLTAYLPDSRQEKLLREMLLEKLTENSICKRAVLTAELATVKKRGYALNDREEFLKICGIAAPIFDLQGNVPASICIWSLVERADIKALRALAPLLLETAANISARLGWQTHERGERKTCKNL